VIDADAEVVPPDEPPAPAQDRDANPATL